MAVLLAGCASEVGRSLDVDETACTDCTAEDTGSETTFTSESPDRNLAHFAINTIGLAIDETGNIVTGVGLIDADGREYTTPSVRLWTYASMQDYDPRCEVVWEVTSSELVDTDVVYGLTFGGQTQNIWRWTLTQVSDDCVEPVATPADQRAIEFGARFVREEVFAAIGTPGDKFPGTFGSFGFFPEEELDSGTLFIDYGLLAQGWSAAIPWADEDPVILNDNTVIAATLPQDHAPGDLLQSVFYKQTFILYPL